MNRLFAKPQRGKSGGSEVVQKSIGGFYEIVGQHRRQ
jgi:hypothetical protein